MPWTWPLLSRTAITAIINWANIDLHFAGCWRWGRRRGSHHEAVCMVWGLRLCVRLDGTGFQSLSATDFAKSGDSVSLSIFSGKTATTMPVAQGRREGPYSIKHGKRPQLCLIYSESSTNGRCDDADHSNDGAAAFLVLLIRGPTKGLLYRSYNLPPLCIPATEPSYRSSVMPASSQPQGFPKCCSLCWSPSVLTVTQSVICVPQGNSRFVIKNLHGFLWP